MRIAIIGAGTLGSALSRAAVKAGHTVVVTDKEPHQAAAVAGDTGASAADDTAAAIDGADVVVLAVPRTALVAVAQGLAQAAPGKVVVDATNPPATSTEQLIERRYRGPRHLAVMASAAELQQRLPGAPVVKAFNTILASRYASPTEDGTPLDAFYAGDDERAKAVVAELAGSLGFRPVDVGGLRHARALEEMALLNVSLNARSGWSGRSAWKLVGPIG